jgi:hypothetical protein
VKVVPDIFASASVPELISWKLVEGGGAIPEVAIERSQEAAPLQIFASGIF